MPRATLPLHVARDVGSVLAWTAAIADGLAFPSRNGSAVLVRNGSAGTITVTLPTPGTVEGLAVAERAVAVAAGAIALIGPTPAVTQPDGNVHLDFSAVAGVDAVAVQTV